MKRNLSRPLLFSLISIVAYTTTSHGMRACISSSFPFPLLPGPDAKQFLYVKRDKVFVKQENDFIFCLALRHKFCKY